MFLMKECTKIKDKENLLALKFGSLWKHGGKENIFIVVPRVYKVGEFYMNKGFVHAKNEHLYIIY